MSSVKVVISTIEVKQHATNHFGFDLVENVLLYSKVTALANGHYKHLFIFRAVPEILSVLTNERWRAREDSNL